MPADLEETNVKWYIPHHGIYYPHKPAKTRVVFDYSAKYQGKSLNDLLLSGPDLTHSVWSFNEIQTGESRYYGEY